ncbi:hypothetical protein ZIOFF_028006 [Zingiber officinale]|uniref:Uncharacterized protein n=1 Tax=Zingiber officinale TaxID=94328 RepID=A0A8J5LEJ1_ZINOF|nr:hypothetical protein ZIOFF_028006 [Zingiber officinale]
MTSSSSGPGVSCSYSFKILLIGDTGVGKSSLLVSFISNNLVDDLSPTIGVDFKIKHLTIADKKLKLTIWDTVYDVTKRETFTNIADVWIKEIELYATNHNCIKVLVGNKADKVISATHDFPSLLLNHVVLKVLFECSSELERTVTSEEGIAFANEYKCLFLECSAKTRSNVERCFEELALKILEVPELLEEGSAPAKRNILRQKQDQQEANQGGCCS